jgi:uncharacterized membrane protein YoaK (UPF0700 family)
MNTISNLTEEKVRPVTPARERDRVVLLLCLTFVTGIVDVVSYVGLGHVFVANMTGNVVLIGAALSTRASVPITPVALTFVSFFLGAALAGRIYSWLRRSTLSGVILLGLSTILLSGTGALLEFAPLSSAVPMLPIAALALAMGLQGGWARAYPATDLPTVVVTSTLVGLAFQSSLGTGESVRWRRRTVAIVLLVAGGVAGGFLLRISSAAALGVSAVVTMIVAAASLRVKRDTSGDVG